MAIVTDSNRPQPLWQPPPTACPTASMATSAVLSILMLPLGGGGGAWRPDGLLSVAGGAYCPLAASPCPSLEPSPSAGGGAHRPLTPQVPSLSLSLAHPHLPTPPALPSVGCTHAAPGLSPFHCAVSRPHGRGQRPSPGASQWTPPSRWRGAFPLLGPGRPLAGSLPHRWRGGGGGSGGRDALEGAEVPPPPGPPAYAQPLSP